MSIVPPAFHTALVLGLCACFASSTAAQVCPESSWSMGNENGAVVAPAFDTTISDFYGGGRLYYEGSGDSLSMSVGTSMFGGGSQLIVRQTYVLVGGAAGTPVSFHLRWPAAAGVYSEAPPCGYSYVVARLRLDDVAIAGGVYYASGDEFCGNSVSLDPDVLVQRSIGQPFTVVQEASANIFYIGSASVTGALRFEGLPPGVAVVSCFGDTIDAGPEVLDAGPEAPLALRIDAIVPHPARGAIHLAVSLPRGGPAVLRLFDVAGRLVEARTWDVPAASQHRVTMGGALTPGTYYLRLSQGLRTATRAVTVVH